MPESYASMTYVPGALSRGGYLGDPSAGGAPGEALRALSHPAQSSHQDPRLSSCLLSHRSESVSPRASPAQNFLLEVSDGGFTMPVMCPSLDRT